MRDLLRCGTFYTGQGHSSSELVDPQAFACLKCDLCVAGGASKQQGQLDVGAPGCRVVGKGDNSQIQATPTLTADGSTLFGLVSLKCDSLRLEPTPRFESHCATTRAGAHHSLNDKVGQYESFARSHSEKRPLRKFLHFASAAVDSIY